MRLLRKALLLLFQPGLKAGDESSLGCEVPCADAKQVTEFKELKGLPVVTVILHIHLVRC